MKTWTTLAAALAMALLGPMGAEAQPAQAEAGSVARQSDDAALARELSNPIADLVSVPVQSNYDRGYGPDDGWRLTTNVQPVIPFHLNEDWNLISRTIVPLVGQKDIFAGAGSQFGLGDVTQTLFFSPSRPTEGGLTWGVGPVVVLPTATRSQLGAEKWAAGPSGVALVQRGPWTVGALANHVWSFAGDDKRTDLNRSFVQPFAAYTTPTAWTFSLQSETTYDWQTETWAVPVNVAVSKLTRIGAVPVSLQAGLGYWLETPAAGPDELRARLAITVMLPR
ncbi:transporter [Albimonas sp. CAU 1670]|uniref:transporter n=1 Tax=Albimonas sp. CAU 1670 TaxID=3032599 RepID=UPI0023DB7EEF|nr:transporter [Albimonas sp. CAU 1670]MDF2235753.1 transporter [Albimonas sp. CAU 1670]